MINDFLTHLGLLFKHEGSQLVIDCPECGKEKHCHVAPDTGLWHCKVCNAKGNPWRLTEIMQSNLDSKGIYQLLKDHGLASGEQYSRPEKKPHLTLTRDDIRPMTEEELSTVCATKQISRAALLKFTPYAHAREPLMLIPAFEPGNLSKACGWLRCRFDGTPIVLGNGNSVKYPIVSGSVHGLFGLKWLTEEQPETIIFVEGWRDALAAISLGYAATASSGGASTWYDTWLPAFKEKQVYIIMDRDDAGQHAAHRAANAILAVAKSVKIVELPYELKKDHGSDLYDYICRDGHIKDDVDKLLKNAPSRTAGDCHTDNKHIILPDDHPDTVAEAFEKWSIEECGVRHRFNATDGWSIYHAEKYQQIENDEEIEKYIREFIKNKIRIKTKIKGEDGKYTTYNASPDKKLKTKGFVENVMAWLRDMDGVHLRPSQKAPCSINGQLNPKNIIALQNGLLDITDRKKPILSSFTPDFYTFNYLPFSYDPTRKAPTWLWALGEYFQDDDGRPDTLVPPVLHSRIKKYILRDTSDHKIMAIVGRRRSGKGTIARAIQELLGTNNVASLTISSLASDFGLQPLLNKQLAIMWDASLAGRTADTNKAVEILKNISGEDGVQVNRKGKSQINLPKLPINLMVVANKVLDLRDSSGALAGRFTFLETTKSFYGHEDPSIEEKIRAEIPGIFNLILASPEGEILEHPKSHILQNEFEELSSPYIAFINEWCVIDPDEFIPCDVLWAYYCEWCKLNNHQPPSPQKFKIDFNGVHDDVKRYRPQLTDQQVSVMKIEYNLDARPGRKLDVTNRPRCYQCINVKSEVKSVWNVQERP